MSTSSSSSSSSRQAGGVRATAAVDSQEGYEKQQQ
jgi:hypothetical protein